MTELIIFDMDGVLTDSEPLINEAAVNMFHEKGHKVQPEDFYPFVGTGEDRYIQGVAEKYGVELDVPSAKKRTYEIYLDLVPNKLRAFPGAVELVHECREKGLKTAVASSADIIKVEANLNSIGLLPDKDWDFIVAGEMVKNKKPAPDIFLFAANQLGCAPSRCVVIEDAVHGIEAANAAEMWCIGVAQTFPAEQLTKANIVFPSLADLKVEEILPK